MATKAKTKSFKQDKQEKQARQTPGGDWQKRLDSELGDSFPASDPPSMTQPEGLKPGGPERTPAGERKI